MNPALEDKVTETVALPRGGLPSGGGEHLPAEVDHGRSTQAVHTTQKAHRSTVSAIVVTHDNAVSVSQTLQSLRSSTLALREVVVADQASGDGTLDLVRRDFSEVLALAFPDNPGFGEGNNRAARVASGDYLLLINPDATVDPDCVEKLVLALDSDSNVAVAVPKTLMGWEPDVLNSIGLEVNRVLYGWDRGYLEYDRGQYDQPEQLLAGSGCALLVRASAFEQVGGFDPRYFLYYEDLDLCLRLRRAGYQVVSVPSAQARHFTHASGRSPYYSDYLDHRNRTLTFFKSLPPPLLLRWLPGFVWFEMRALVGAGLALRFSAVKWRLAAWAWNLAHLFGAGSRPTDAEVGSRARQTPEELEALFCSSAGAPAIAIPIPDYREAYADLLDPDRAPSGFDMAQRESATLGLGWHGVEEWDGQHFRWSCDYGVLFLGRKPEHRRLQLCLRALRPTTVRVSIDGESCAELSVDCEEFTLHEVALPETDGTAVEVVHVMLRVDPVAVPSRDIRGSRDRRCLGVALASVRLVARGGNDV